MPRGRRTTDFVDLILEQWRHERPELDVSSISVLGRMHRCDLRYSRLLNEELEEFGLNWASFDVLTALRRSGPDYRRSAGDLAQAGLVSTGGVTQRLDRLERDGLVERVRVPEDRRVVYVQLTPAGLELIDQAVTSHFARQEAMLAGLSRSDREKLANLLSALERSLEAYEQAGPTEG